MSQRAADAGRWKRRNCIRTGYVSLLFQTFQNRSLSPHQELSKNRRLQFSYSLTFNVDNNVKIVQFLWHLWTFHLGESEELIANGGNCDVDSGGGCVPGIGFNLRRISRTDKLKLSQRNSDSWWSEVDGATSQLQFGGFSWNISINSYTVSACV